jgi:glycogen synthase
VQVLDVIVQSYFEGNMFNNKIWTGTVEGYKQLSVVYHSIKFNLHWPNKKIAYAGLPVYFIEPQHPAKFFWRAQYYGEGDDFKRFSYFSRAALELLYQSGKKVDIIHCHDWQTAFVVSVKIIWQH